MKMDGSDALFAPSIYGRMMRNFCYNLNVTKLSICMLPKRLPISHPIPICKFIHSIKRKHISTKETEIALTCNLGVNANFTST